MQSILKRVTPQQSVPIMRQPLPVASPLLVRTLTNGRNSKRGTRAGVPLVLKALLYLRDDPGALEVLRNVCSVLRTRIDSDARMRAQYLLIGRTQHTVLYAVCSAKPHALTPSVFFALTALGAHLPKFLVETVVTHNVVGPAVKSSRSWVAALHQDTIDHIVALGFKLYADLLLVAKDGEQVKDDPWAFEDILASETPDLTALRKVVYDHHFVPVLVPRDSEFWITFYSFACRLLRLDAKLAQHIILNSTLDQNEAAERFVHQALLSPSTTKKTMQELESAGYFVTESIALAILTNPAASKYPNPSIQSISLLQEILPDPTLISYITKGLKTLLKTLPTNSHPSPQQADTLLRLFHPLLSDASVAPCILATPPPGRERTLPFYTAFGQTHGGIVDALWQVICAEFGPTHPFVAAYLVDVVIGGTIPWGGGVKKAEVPAPTSVVQAEEDTIAVVAPDGVIRRKSISVLRPAPVGRKAGLRVTTALALASSPASGGTSPGLSRSLSATVDSRMGLRGFLEQAQDELDEFDSSDDRDRDVSARETIQAMVEGVCIPFDAGMLIPVCRAVLIMKSVRSRVLDFLSRAEKELLSAAYSPTAVVDFDSDSYARLSRTKWISALYRNVIDSQGWMEQVMTTSELTVLEGLKPGSSSSEHKSKRRTAIHPPVPGIFSGSLFEDLLENAGDASVVEMDKGPIPANVAAVARSVRMRRQKSVSSASMPLRRFSVAVQQDQRQCAELRRFYQSCEVLVELLEAGQSGDAGLPVPEGPFGKWLNEKDIKSKGSWLSGASWLSGPTSPVSWF
ncbi:hypothetical protein BC830DRAFT_1146587 [Chytriomyces sp. MP71]|nr:hypothetical protein BC830DRAFT_1146587 [Chytriomyces sp. MP71]